MDQELRNKLRNVVTRCRRLLEDDTRDALEGRFGIFARKEQVNADPNAQMSHLSDEEQEARKDILDHYAHIKARGFKLKEALDQLIREIAFTHLNRLCAYKMMEAREVYVGGQKFREAVSRGVNSNGVKFYLAEHPEEERLFDTGHQDIAYRHFLDWLGGQLSEEIGVLFSPTDPANRLYPRQKTLDEVLDLLNSGGIKAEESELRDQWPQIWSQDETIGWVYQYFTPKELRDQARKESQAPRNSYELAFRNQFFTPRYVVEFLTDNTLGRIWYEMRKGETKLKDQCRYMVRRPTEIFLKDGEQAPKENPEEQGDLSQEELLKLPVHIPHRPKKDPRELKILDPACGSGHFLLYCFDLLLTIYEEAYADPSLGPALKKDYPTLDALKRDVPRLILAHNLHGIDIDLRASQIAALALWLRCQRAYQDMGFKKDRPKITRSNFVCAEPMPGEEQMLKEFVGQLDPKVLGQVVEVVFDKMKLAGEAGSLLKIEEDIRDAVAAAKKQYIRETTQATDRKGQPLLFTQAAMDRIAGKPDQPSLFDLSDITDNQFFAQAEVRVIEALRSYGEKAQLGQRLQRRLFTDDAVRGFAFVDLCQKQYDVVLMNPPFGDPSIQAKDRLTTAYPTCKDDIDAAFVERGVHLLGSAGFLGAIINRSQFFKGVLRTWREQQLLGHSSICEAADLGHGVLDGALVEAAAYVLRKPCLPNHPANFIRLLKETEKEIALSPAIQSLQNGVSHGETFIAAPLTFAQLPEARISYWASPAFRQAYSGFSPLEGNHAIARAGLQTGDNFRFLRLVWEIASEDICTSRHDTHVQPPSTGRRWCYYAKGGEYAPYFGDVHLVVEWTNDGATVIGHVDKAGKPASYPRSKHLYFEPALTYTERTASGFSPRVMPRGCVFDVKGPIIAPNSQEAALAFLGLVMSRVFATFLEFAVASGDAAVSGSAARQYTQGIVGGVPCPPMTATQRDELITLTGLVWKWKCDEDSETETSRYFVVPSIIRSARDIGTQHTLAECAEATLRRQEERNRSIIETSWKIEQIVRCLYKLDQQALQQIDDDFGVHPELHSKTPLNPEEAEALQADYTKTIEDVIDEEVQSGGGSRSVTKKAYFADRQLELLCGKLRRHPDVLIGHRQQSRFVPKTLLFEHSASLVSYAVGSLFGRWNVRHATGEQTCLELPSPFDSLPACPVGVLQEKSGANKAPSQYPLQIVWEGILVDDIEHDHDVVKGVQRVLELLFKQNADAIEDEACGHLASPDLRAYFRKPGKGGFWDDHVSRYSKSRRNAPIYWLLQSSKKNYAIWLYYHRLDKDLLFKALVNYVEPKIRLETSRLESLRNQKAAAGDSGKEAKRLAKDVERQEDFLSELRDFEDKLRRAANLNLEPDLNDGVVLNIAPLHEIVPWKEARKYWDELLEGQYEWSSIGKQLRDKGLVK